LARGSRKLRPSSVAEYGGSKVRAGNRREISNTVDRELS
jgi:hypothetical protein